MKNNLLKLVLIAAVAALGLAALPTTAEAGPSSHRFSHKCGKCHTPIYKRLVFAGYDSCGRSVYRWTLVTHRCAPPPRHSGHGHHGRHHDSSAEVIVGGVLNFLADRHRAHKRIIHGRRGYCD